MDVKFFDSLFSGDSANGSKLCLGLTEGDFWSRPAGVQLLYQGRDCDIDFDKIVIALGTDEDTFEISAGRPLSNSIYVLRRANCCGVEEKTFSAAVRVEFDSLGNLIEYSCNKIFIAAAEQIEGNKILLKWFYQPIHQSKKINNFKIYYDNGTGIIDYQIPLGSVSFKGRRFYQFVTNELSGNNYKFCIRTVAEDNSDNGFTGQIDIGLNRQNPNGVSILQSSVV
ncbi:MAG: hypothetical protein ABSE89_07315 [Sedimentisphaerales bacterium]